MSLVEQPVVIRFANGVDTKSDSKAVPLVKLLAAENVVFTRAGSLAKRNGYDLLSKDIDGSEDGYGTARALAARDDELLLFAGGRALSRRTSSASWSDIGAVSALTSTERAIIKTGTQQTAADAWSAGGITVTAWEDSRGGVWMAVLEEETDRVLRLAAQLDANGQSPRVMAVGGVFHVYWLRAATGEIMIVVVNPTNYLETLTPALLTDGVHLTAPGYDVAPTARTGSPAVMVWPTPAGDLRISYVDSSGVLGSPVTGHPTGITVVGFCPAGAPVGVTWDPETNVVLTVALNGVDANAESRDADDLTSLFLAVTVPGVTDSTGVRLSIVSVLPPPGQIVAFWFSTESTAALPQNARCTFYRVIWDGVTTAVNASSLEPSDAFLRGHGLASRLFMQGFDAYAVLVHAVPFFPYCPIVRLDGSFVLSLAGRVLVGTSAGQPTRRVLPSVSPSTADPMVMLFPGLYRELAPATEGSAQFTETGIRACRLDFDDDDALQSARLGADLVVAGSSPLRYDGDTLAELGFHTAPDGEVTAVGGTGGGLTPNLTYLWRASYREVDAAGEIHQGPMSIDVLLTLGGAQNAATLTIPAYRLTGKRRVSIDVWRTLGDDDSSDPQFFRVTSLNPSATGPNGYLVNDIHVDTLTFVDHLSDDDLLRRERAYTNFGVLSNDPAALGALVAGGKNRLFFSAADDANKIYYSQQRREGYGPETSSELALPLDPEGGAVTAIAVLDEAVIAWKRGSTYFFAGPGPLPNPDASPQIGFTEPQLVTSDVGCISPRSIAVTPIGVIFKSARGYHLIDRSRQVRYVGADVERYNGLNVVAAVALPDRTSILVLHSDGPALHYDYYFGEWSTFTNHEALDAIVAGNQYYFLRNDIVGAVAQENRGIFLDGTREIRLYLETAWVKFTQYVQGWQKLWYAHIVGEYVSPHVLRMRIATDYRPGWDAPYDLTPDVDYLPAPYGEGAYGEGAYGGDADQLYQERVHVSEQCQAARFSFEDQASGETQLGGSFILTELLLTGGVVRPAVKTQASRSR